MNEAFIAQLGNWNPQLLREFRGRLKSRSFVAAIALSIILQGLLLLTFQDRYDTGDNWSELWKTLTWSIPYLLFSIGSYYIVSNIVQEEKSGTLNFIRLSPRPAWQILLGKLIGVPILPLVAIGLLIPLHLFSGLLGGVSIFLMLSFYIVLPVAVALCWSLALLFGFFGSHRSGLAGQANSLAIAFTALTFFILSPLYMTWNIFITWSPISGTRELFSSNPEPIHWAWMPINTSILMSHGFTLINLVIFIALAWRILLRRFRRPLSPLFSRRQSYGISAYLIFLVIGFTLAPTIDESYQSYSAFDLFSESGIAVVLIFGYLLTLAMMSGICPQRQALVEWSRNKTSGFMGYLWSDKSPAILSFGVILLIINALVIPWVLFSGVKLPSLPTESNISNIIGTLVIIAGGTSTLFMIGCFLQFIMSLKLRNPSIWFAGSLLLWWVVPPIVLGILNLEPSDYAIASTIWAFFGYPLGHLDKASHIGYVIAGIFAQCCVSGFLLLNLKQSLSQIKTIGTSSVV